MKYGFRLTEKGSRKLETIESLERVCEECGVTLVELENQRHFRICGNIRVDYWPGTNRAWVVGSRGKASKMSVEDAVALAVACV